MFGFTQTPGAGSVTKQLCDYLRERIMDGTLPAGTRLPPTRQAAQELRVARNIVIEVYEQLSAEGYLISRTGAGTFVAEGIRAERSAATRRTEADVAMPGSDQPNLVDFYAGTPDLRHFPRRLWSKLVRQVIMNEPERIYDYGDPQGLPALREALARYVYRAKGIVCGPERIVVTSGTSEAFMLIAAAFSDEFRDIYVEDPTIDFTAEIFKPFKYDIHPVFMDEQGMLVEDIADAPAGIVVLTPSHQYPTGRILSIQRRQEVVRSSELAGHYLLEDDYDSEFRYKGVPVPPLQLLSPERVIYSGTFSKTLSPSLRIGFLVVPSALVDRVVRTKTKLNLVTPGVTQMTLSSMLEEGHFDRHIHRMKALYKKKRHFLTELVHRMFEGQVRIEGDEAGLNIQLVFPPERFGNIDWSTAKSFGVQLSALDDYARVKGRYPGMIVLGYGQLDEEEIEEGIRRLRAFVEAARTKS